MYQPIGVGDLASVTEVGRGATEGSYFVAPGVETSGGGDVAVGVADGDGGA